MSKRNRKRGKTLEDSLNRGWVQIVDPTAVTEEDMAYAIDLHNKQYAVERTVAPSPNGDTQRLLPVHYSRVVAAPALPKVVDEWHCEVKDVEGCPIVGEAVIEVPYEMYNAWTELAAEIKTEWMMYLKGDLNQESGRARITECYAPPQSASGCHVEQPDEDYRPQTSTMGAVHSHVSMNAFFSRTDVDHANWPVEIVVNAKGEYDLRMRVKLECGRFSRVKGKLMLIGARAADVYREQLQGALKKPDAKGRCDRRNHD